MRHFTSRMPIIVLGAAMICSTSIVQAGQAPSPGAEQPAAGAFILEPAIMLTDFGVDSNILATPESPKSDLTANVRMQIAPSGALGPVSVRGQGGLALAYFQQYAAQRSADADGSVGLDLRLNRFTFHAAGAAVRIRDSFGPEIDLRVRRVETALEGGAGVRVGGKTWIGAGITRSGLAFNASEVLFETSLRTALDRTVNTFSLTARHSLTPLTTIVALADTQYDRFAFWPLRDTNGARVVAGVEFKPTALIAGRAHVGYRRFISRDSTQPSVDGPTASVDLAYTLADAVRFRARVERDLAHSFSLTERYFAWTEMLFSVTRRVNTTWDITAMAGRRRLDYRGALAPSPEGEPTDYLFRYGGGVEYRLGNATTVGADAEYYRRESELNGRTYDRLRLVSSIGYRF